MASTEAQKRASARYNKTHTIQIPLRLNRNTDTDILAALDKVPSRAGYIKALIRADIATGGPHY